MMHLMDLLGGFNFGLSTTFLGPLLSHRRTFLFFFVLVLSLIPIRDCITICPFFLGFSVFPFIAKLESGICEYKRPL
jgi:hypothetical protein